MVPAHMSRSEQSASDMDVEYIAHLARIRLTDEEKERFAGQLGQILAYVEELGELDVEGVEPTAHAVPVHNVFREDVARPGLDRDTVLGNAPATRSDQFLVPRIIE